MTQNKLPSLSTYSENCNLWQVAAKKLTLKSVTDYIADIICKRAEIGYNYGVILIPEGLIDFIPEVKKIKIWAMLSNLAISFALNA